MPELAEVEFYRKQWDAGLGARIEAVALHARKRIFRGSNPRELREHLTGSRFTEAMPGASRCSSDSQARTCSVFISA